MDALLTTRVTLAPGSSFTPLIGDWRVGAVAFRVDPSALAFPSTAADALGDAGALVCLLHAPAVATRASPPTSTNEYQNLRLITEFPPRTSSFYSRKLRCTGQYDTRQLSVREADTVSPPVD